MDDVKSTDWQAWFAHLKHSLSSEGWRQFAEDVGATDVDETLWSAQMVLFSIRLNAVLATTMALASLQLPEEQAIRTLGDIAQTVRDARYDRSPKAVPRQWRDVYRQSTSSVLRFLPSSAEVLSSVFACYLRGEYDLESDANLRMRECQQALSVRNRPAALSAIGRAGAAALCGAHVWPGWSDEGDAEFRQWALSLITILEQWQEILPFGPAADERTRAKERSEKLATPRRGRSPTPAVEIIEPSQASPAELQEEWFKLISRGEPLSDEEIRALGDRYEALAELALDAIHFAPEGFDLEPMNLGVMTLGLLRYDRPQAIAILIAEIAGQDEAEVEADDEDFGIAHDAVWALQQMGGAVVPAVLEFLRYSTNEQARSDMLEVLGVAGRGSEEVFTCLAAEFATTTWTGGKSDLAGAFALLHDARVIPLIVEALRDPAAGEQDAWNLLDALEELDVTFYVNRDQRSVSIPDYGIVEDVLPVNWKSRQELAEEAEEDEDDDEVDDDDDFEDGDEDGDEEEDYEGVVYDAQGVPRCPDCGAEMYYEAGEWLHGPAPLAPEKQKKVGRNDPCPCGSGKKYKHCHGKGL